MIRFAIAGATGRMGRAVLGQAADDDRFTLAAAITVSDDPLLGQRLQIGPTDVSLVDKIDGECDVLIDFTLPAGTMHWLDQCVQRNIPMVIGATGHDAAQLDRITKAAASIPIVKATNFSLGVNALLVVAKQLAAALGPDYDIEIVETHHRRKVDAPSGTAASFLEAVQAGRAGDLSASTKQQDSQESTAPPPSPPLAKGGLLVVHGRKGETGPRPRGEIGVHALRMGDVVGHHEIHFGGPGETITITHTAHSRTTFAAGALHAAAWLVGKPPGLYAMADVLHL